MSEKKHLVAVYGSLKRGFGNHQLLTDAEFLGEDTIGGWRMLHLGGFPGIIDGNSEEIILIEAYKVSDDEFTRLDSLEGYPSFYNRKQVSTSFGDAWIYFLNDQEYYAKQNTVVKSGVWGD